MPIVDVHTHIYPPSFMELLRSRNEVPYIRDGPGAVSRLIILPGEDDRSIPAASRGRPVGPNYYDITKKIEFMDTHHIDVSVISLANPWLDFLPPEEAVIAARDTNCEIDKICSSYPGRLFAFGTLPLSADTDHIVTEIENLSNLNYMRGVIIGTSGLGKGLDDPALDPIYSALERHQQLTFIHPHYGLPSSVFGPRAADYGHVLPLALGFPLETTVAVTRMFLSGIWERHQGLQVLLAHSGGTLPFLAGRIESCIGHDAQLQKQGKLKEHRRTLWDVLRENVYLDAVIYSEVGLKAAIAASGAERVMFGTDNPFFPPLDESQTEWDSVKANYTAIKNTCADNKRSAEDILGANAVRVLKLET